MTMQDFRQLEITVAGEVVYRIENATISDQETLTFDGSQEALSPIGEAVRKVVGEYGEVLRRLSDE